MSIVRRIKREARNSPGKALLLAGLLGLALYSWAPLVAGWLAGSGESSGATAKSERNREEPATAAPSTVAAEQDEATEDRPSWQELQQWRQASPWASPVELTQMRDPFRAVAPESETVDASEANEEVVKTKPEQMFAGLDLPLTGTIVGPKRRVAILDGQAYREGDIIRVERLGTTWELEIRRITPNRVVLGWQSIEHELRAPKRQPVGRIELVDRSM